MIPNLLNKSLFPLHLAIIVLFSMAVMDKATPAGAGLANDSVAYIAGARSILQGTGYSDIWLDSTLEPITHYPPLLSIVLSAIGLAGIDPLRSVRVLNILLFGSNTLLIALVGYQLIRSKWISLWLAALFLLNSSLLRVSLYAMSEPLFLTLCLLAFLAFFLALEQNFKPSWLLLTGVFTGLSVLARYSGLALVPAFGLLLLLAPIDLKQKGKNLLYFLSPIALAVGAWFLRNKLVASSFTNRTLEIHPITLDNVLPGIYNLSRIFLPLDQIREPIFNSGVWNLILLGVLLCMVVGTIVLLLRIMTGKEASTAANAVTTLLVFFFSYLGSIFFSISFFDNSTKFQDRILAPAVIVFFILAGLVFQKTAALFEKTKLVKLSRGVVAASMIGSILFSFAGEAEAMKIFSTEGQGYASWKYHDSAILAAIRDLPQDVSIYTNSPPAVYLVTERSSRVMPTKTDPVSNTTRPDYEQDIEKMVAQINNGEAVLALFNTNDIENSSDAGSIESIITRLNSLKKTGDAELFGVSLP